MKALKLMGVFVLIVGIIAGAIYLPKIIDHTIDDSEYVDDSLKAIVEKIDKEWEIEQRWDKDLYKRHRNLISQYENKLSEAAYKLALDSLDIIVSNVLWTQMRAEFSKSDCSYKKVSRLKQGADFVKKNLSASNVNMDELQKSTSVYWIVRNFATSSHMCNVIFDGEKWSTDVKKNKKSAEYKSFAEYEKDIRATRVNHLDNKYYNKYLSEITEIKQGLGQNKVEEKLAKAKVEFYNELTDSIINYYSRLEKTTDNFERLKKCKVSDEIGSTPEILRNFLKEFRDGVNRNSFNSGLK